MRPLKAKCKHRCCSLTRITCMSAVQQQRERGVEEMGPEGEQEDVTSPRRLAAQQRPVQHRVRQGRSIQQRSAAAASNRPAEEEEEDGEGLSGVGPDSEGLRDMEPPAPLQQEQQQEQDGSEMLDGLAPSATAAGAAGIRLSEVEPSASEVVRPRRKRKLNRLYLSRWVEFAINY